MPEEVQESERTCREVEAEKTVRDAVAAAEWNTVLLRYAVCNGKSPIPVDDFLEETRQNRLR